MNSNIPGILDNFTINSGPPISLALGTLVVLIIIGIRYLDLNRERHNYPPGPQGIPFFGNLFQVPQDAWLTFTDWKSQYGNLVYISMAGQPIVILNSHKVAADLLDRRANNYSDRPRWIVASELLTGGLLIAFTKYGDVWRRMRRAGHGALNRQVASNFHEIQTKEALILTEALLKTPQDWDANIKRATASMVMSVVYDTPMITSQHDPSIALVNDFVDRLVRAAWPGAHFVEFFPWMLKMPNWLPQWMIKWKTDALESYRRDSKMFEDFRDNVQKRIDAGDERPSFTASLIRENTKNALSSQEQAWLSANMYSAGAETTAGVMAWFMMAMILYPEVQQRAQDELDRVVGRSRMPTFTDRQDLPYISACVREALRWHPVGPIGLLHQSVADDVYEGYFIPKGTICIANVWALNSDPEVYGADAHHFNPGRFIDKEGNLSEALADTKDGHVTFGFGRRICIGRHIATNSLFIDIACALWAATIRPPKDNQGNPIIPDADKSINGGLVVHPVPFDCNIVHRFPEAEGLLADAVEEARAVI